MREPQALERPLPRPGRLRPIPLFVAVVGIFVVAEALIMLLLSRLPSMPILAVSLLDAVLLAVIALPILWLVFLVPLQREVRQRLQQEQELMAEKAFRDAVLDSLPFPFYVIDARDYTVQLANRKARADAGGALATCHALTHHREEPCTGEEHPCPLKEVKASGNPVVLEHVHLNEANEPRICEVHGYPIFAGDGRVAQMIELSLDITERKNMENQLRAQRQFTAKLIKYSAVPTFVLDAQHRILFWNKPCERMTGIKAADMVGTTGQWRPFYAHPRPCLADLVLDGTAEQAGLLYGFIEKSRVLPHGYHAEGWFENIGGERRYLVFEAAPIFDDAGKTVAAIETLRDITSRKEMEEALAHQAMRDELTDIYNRRMLDELLKQEVLRATRYRTPFSLVMFDLDYFKNINDTYGHDVGDAVLREVTAVMRKQIRATDHFGRWGGEEFMLLAPETVLAQAVFLAEKLRLHVEGHRFEKVQFITMSIGVGEYRPGEGGDGLIKRVDDALYRAKESGRNVVLQAE